MASLEAADVLKVLVVAVTWLMGALVLAANARRGANVAFAAFVFLIGGNFLSDFLIAAQPPSSEAQRNWTQAGFVFFILDPLALLYFAGIFPRRNRLHDWRVLGPFALAALLLLAYDVFVGFQRDYALTPERVLLFAYMSLAYAIALVGLLVAASGEKSPTWKAQSHALAAGLGGALLPRFGLIPVELALIDGNTVEAWLLGAALSAAVALLVYASARLRGADPLGLRRPFALAAGVAAIFVGGWLLAALTRAGLGDSTFLDEYLGIYQFSLRWILFSLIVGAAILRYQLVRFDNRLARPLSWLLPLLLVALVAFVAQQGLAGAGKPTVLGFQPDQLVVVVALAAGVPLALHWRPRVFEALRLPGSRDRLEFYRQVLLEALQNPSPEREAMLSELRRVCGISDEADQLLRTSLAQGVAPRLVAGALLAGRYRVVEVAGRGVATVWRGEDERLGRPVALKPVGSAQAPSFEAVALTRLQHPAILQVFDLVESASGPVLVTEWAEGRTLRERIAEKRLAPGDAANLALPLLGGLGAVHSAGIVHGDVKPENILLTPAGLKLADFGVSRLREGQTQELGPPALQGTPRYLPPEALLAGQAGPEADVWALALVLLEMMEGSASLHDRDRALARLARRHAGLAGALRQALDSDPARRISTAPGLGQAIKTALS